MGVTMGAGADEKIRQGGQVVSVVRVARIFNCNFAAPAVKTPYRCDGSLCFAGVSECGRLFMMFPQYFMI